MRIRNSGSLSTAHRAPGQPELVCVGLPVPSRPKHFTYVISLSLSLSLSPSLWVFVCYMQVFICVHSIETRIWPSVSSSIISYLTFGDRISHRTWSSGWPASSEDLPVAAPLSPPTFPCHTCWCYRSIPQHPAFTRVLESEQGFMLA